VLPDSTSDTQPEGARAERTLTEEEFETLDLAVDQLGAIAQLPDSNIHLRNLYANLEDIRSRLAGEE